VYQWYEPQSAKEKHADIGRFEIRFENVQLFCGNLESRSVAGKCCRDCVYSGTMFIWEHTGADKGQNWWNNVAYYSGMFKASWVRMGEWPVYGLSACCTKTTRAESSVGRFAVDLRLSMD
jgi:hypothetical protein